MLYFGELFQKIIIFFLNKNEDKIEVVNRLKKESAWGTIKNYTIDYDKTWIFDKIQFEKFSKKILLSFQS